MWSNSRSDSSDSDGESTYGDEYLCVTLPSARNRFDPLNAFIKFHEKREVNTSSTGNLRASSSSQSGQFGGSMTDEFFREEFTSHRELPGSSAMTTHDELLWNQLRLEDEIVRRTIGEPRQRQIDRIVDPRAPDFLLATDWTTKEHFYRSLEDRAFKEYEIADPTREYRGGISKSSFCYLLLDPRVTRDLPKSGLQLSVEDRWKRFLEGVFYVGQGKAARPDHHLRDAIDVWSNRTHVNNISSKIQRILDIWQEGKGVICLNVFSHTMVEEACSREASMIDALQAKLTNRNSGTYYGHTTTMSAEEKGSLGKYLLYKAMEIFMRDGEREIFPPGVSVVSKKRKPTKKAGIKKKPTEKAQTKTKPMKKGATKKKPGMISQAFRELSVGAAADIGQSRHTTSDIDMSDVFFF